MSEVYKNRMEVVRGGRSCGSAEREGKRPGDGKKHFGDQ